MNRRVAITGGLCAAVAVPVTVHAFVDAELVQLGKVMDDLEAQMAKAQERAKPHIEAFYRILEEYARPATNDQFKEAWRKADLEHPLGRPTCDDVTDSMGPVTRRIMALEAHSLAGLAAKARAAKSACWHFWKEPNENADWDHLVARHLIDAVIRLAEARS